MPQTKKIATCCYCGSRAVLVLDRSRHELSCGSCGAPLHEMKMMPVSRPVHREKTAVETVAAATRRKKSNISQARGRLCKPKKDRRRKGKSLTGKVFEELWDVIEDIFD